MSAIERLLTACDRLTSRLQERQIRTADFRDELRALRVAAEEVDALLGSGLTRTYGKHPTIPALEGVDLRAPEPPEAPLPAADEPVAPPAPAPKKRR